MGWISAVFAAKLAACLTGSEAGGKGQERNLLSSTGLDPDGPVDAGRMIADNVFFDLLEHVAAHHGDGRSVPVRVGASMCCNDYGAFGLAFKSAPDLLGSYRRVERYGRVVTSIANFQLVPERETTLMEVIPGSESHLGLKMANELAIAAATAISREVSSAGFRPLAIHLTQKAPSDTTEQQAFFDCPVHYGSDRDALEVAQDVLERPNRLSDAGIAAFFDEHLDRTLDEMEPDAELAARVRAAVAEALSEGVPSLDHIARQLGTSSRTLQRRLAETGRKYQDLVVEARLQIAQKLLRKSGYSVAEISFLTGFSDQSSFTRAFKKWTGDTPAGFRRRCSVSGH